nr:NAD(P)-binding domain-containing protein [Synergistaceae bacterium]
MGQKKYKVGIVGIGTVGTEMVKILQERNFPAEEIRILARSERDEEIAGQTFHVLATTEKAFDGLDFAFFAGTEGAIEASVFHRELRVFHHPGKDGYGDREHMVRVERWCKA